MSQIQDFVSESETRLPNPFNEHQQENKRGHLNLFTVNNTFFLIQSKSIREKNVRLLWIHGDISINCLIS